MEGQMSIFYFPEYLPEKRTPVNIRGLMDDGYCPVCDYPLEDLEEKCPKCGELIDWTRWREI